MRAIAHRGGQAAKLTVPLSALTMAWWAATPLKRAVPMADRVRAWAAAPHSDRKPFVPTFAICGRLPPCKVFRSRIDQIACAHMSGLRCARTYVDGPLLARCFAAL